MAGHEVTRVELDHRMAQALVAARNVVADIETINAFLARVPSDSEFGDPLTIPVDSMGDLTVSPGRFGYTEDEAYLIRSTFEQLAAMRPALEPILDTARGLTGLL